MLTIVLARGGDAWPGDLTVVADSIKDEMQVLGLAHTVEEVAAIEVPQTCREGSGLRFECFQKEVFFASLIERVARDRIAAARPGLPQASRYIYVALTASPIYSAKGRLCGATDWIDSQATWVSLLSTAWLSDEAAPRRDRLLRRLTQHEFGHALGLVPEGREDVEELYGTHCTRVCVMHQGVSVDEFWQLVQEEDRQGVLFCERCRKNLKELASDYFRTFSAES